MKKEDAEEYTQALGQVVAGGWRQIALGDRLGVPKALGLTVNQWVQGRLGGYVKLSIPERREAVAELTAGGKSQREVAAVLGVDPMTVNHDLRAVGNSTNGSGAEAGSVENSTPLDVIAGLAIDESIRRQVDSISEKPHVSNNSGDNEWYTPPVFIEAARGAMGSIDVDPASSIAANKFVGAAKFYTVNDDGLGQPWGGNVWMNPPYAQPLIADFCNALVEKIEAREVVQACVLVNNATETEWFQRLLGHADALCFLCRRVRFLDPSGAPSGAPLQGQIVLYFGEFGFKFCNAFAAFGHCIEPML